MRISIAVAVVALLAARAHADHDGMQMGAVDAPTSTVTAGLSLLAAEFDSHFYGGDYQGVVPAVRWSKGRFGAGASVAFYRLDANGLTTHGFGDAMGDVEAVIASSGRLSLGVMVGVSVPTGNDVLGYGMGHVMVMPSAVGTWTISDRVAVSATGGYGRAVADLGTHDHGMWPLVEPMNMSEITFGAGGDVAIAHGVHGGLRVGGGVPVGAQGHQRLIGAARMAWGGTHIETAAELQAGIAGDPFSVRGVVETALRF